MKFDELNEEQQQKAITKFKSEKLFTDMVSDVIEDAMYDKFAELVNYKGDELHLVYDLYNVQNRGVGFYGVLLEDDIKGLPFDEMIIGVCDDPAVFFNRKRDLNIDIVLDVDDSKYSDDEMKRLEDNVQDWYNHTCAELLAFGDGMIDDYYSDEFVEEFIEADDFNFDENGNLIEG